MTPLRVKLFELMLAQSILVQHNYEFIGLDRDIDLIRKKLEGLPPDEETDYERKIFQIMYDRMVNEHRSNTIQRDKWRAA